MRMNARRIVLALAAVLLVGACSDVTAPAPGPEAALLGVLPEGGATSVSVETQVVLTFSHPLGPGMEAFAVLHVGDVNGPEVGGAWSLSEDRTVLGFSPLQSLAPTTEYTVHIGGGMTDDQGRHMDLGMHGPTMGGAWVTGSMIMGGMGFGTNGGMMGPGWAHPNGGTYGMTFSFTTSS